MKMKDAVVDFYDLIVPVAEWLNEQSGNCLSQESKETKIAVSIWKYWTA